MLAAILTFDWGGVSIKTRSDGDEERYRFVLLGWSTSQMSEYRQHGLEAHATQRRQLGGDVYGLKILG